VEIWEKQSKEKDHRLSKLSNMLSMSKLTDDAPTPGTSSSTIGKIAPLGEILRSGDYFRLRSVKFPDVEIGVTNVRLEKDYFYLGFAKVTNEFIESDDSQVQPLYFIFIYYCCVCSCRWMMWEATAGVSPYACP
jgi:hypothetical protein